MISLMLPVSMIRVLVDLLLLRFQFEGLWPEMDWAEVRVVLGGVVLLQRHVVQFVDLGVSEKGHVGWGPLV